MSGYFRGKIICVWLYSEKVIDECGYMVQGEFDEAIVCPNCENSDQNLISSTINIGMFGLSPNHGYYKCFKCGHRWEEKDEYYGIDIDAY